MYFLEKISSKKLLLISLISSVFIMYPNLAWLPWELQSFNINPTDHILLYICRYVFFCVLIFILSIVNIRKIDTPSFNKRLLYNCLITLVGYAAYAVVFQSVKHMGSIALFQFMVVFLLSTLLGYIYQLYSVQRKKEQEIEQLKIENLQSRYDALTNQINPHFLFNSLNGLTGLIRKKNDKDTLTYVNKLSDTFRYILQSDKKGLVTLEEELEMVQSFRYMMEVRFANKLEYVIDVDNEMLSCKLPVLSILPLIENVVTHNVIDSEHKMAVTIRTNERKELVVTNPVYPKLSPAETNGIGIKNLKNRFLLLMDKQIRVEHEKGTFSIYLPLT